MNKQTIEKTNRQSKKQTTEGAYKGTNESKNKQTKYKIIRKKNQLLNDCMNQLMSE